MKGVSLSQVATDHSRQQHSTPTHPTAPTTSGKHSQGEGSTTAPRCAHNSENSHGTYFSSTNLQTNHALPALPGCSIPRPPTPQHPTHVPCMHRGRGLQSSALRAHCEHKSVPPAGSPVAPTQHMHCLLCLAAAPHSHPCHSIPHMSMHAKGQRPAQQQATCTEMSMTQWHMLSSHKPTPKTCTACSAWLQHPTDTHARAPFKCPYAFCVSWAAENDPAYVLQGRTAQHWGTASPNKLIMACCSSGSAHLRLLVSAP